ncbi:flavin reductase family protein [Blastococcus haudaquaticus]|uniref:Ferredoxin-NADP reductase n=1 Tax=Blastococcus haudaquaticus TaxID=1938745 RepID=A0A286GR92_9ACTN|nr:iron-sulfur cluster-binding domain-containing protein [Blastococcus haudaquaticus]SOD98038.1 Ferredoxin-NADP reductase [Blastococcus haudaquaticus]
MTSPPVDRGRDVTVLAVGPVADRIVEVVLGPADDAPFPRWAPGAHVDVVLPIGVARPYSLAGDPADARSWRLLVARSAPGDASAHIHDELRPGDRLRVRGPRHLFALGGGARYLFLGSGSGIAPLLPMARWVAAARIHPWALVHVDRSARHRTLREEVAALGTGSRTVATADDALAALADAAPGTAVYAAGSSSFVDAVADAAPEHVALNRQRFDAPVGVSGAARPFELVLGRRRERVRVEAGTPLLTALHQAGVDVPVSCGAGICGACVVGVLEGTVEHRDSILTAAERAAGSRIVSCVSTAAGDRLVLDV